MKTEQVDYAVVGHSLAGVAAALVLAESGNRVVLLDFHRDTDSIDDLPFIQSTLLGPRASGVEFEETISETLRRAAVDRQTNCLIIGIYSEKTAIVECSDQRWSCKGVVFAPNGTEPGLDIEGSSALHGFGISYSAVADAPFFESRRVAVYGDSPRVIDHAWVAAQYTSEVLVLVKEKRTEGDAEVLTYLRSSSAIAFEEAVMLRALRVASDRTLSGIEIESSTGRRSIDVSALFVAQHLVPMTNVVRGEGKTDRIAFAGLAAGVEYWKHAGLVNDGRRAARMLMTVHQ
jgi:NADH-dependent peroxiredoxin subunit F